MECITEALHETMVEVNNRAALLKVERQPGETEDTFRTRVACHMVLHYFEGKVSQRILDRLAAWEDVARNDDPTKFWFEKVQL